MTQEPSQSSADPNAEDPDRPPLGQILVESGLLDAGDLERVLEEQRVSGDALGRLLVDGGYVSGPSMALALARQQGTVLKTEYGFGVPKSTAPAGGGAAFPPALNSPDQPEPEPEPLPALRTVELPPYVAETPIRLAPQPGAPEEEPLRLVEPIAPIAPPAPEQQADPTPAAADDKALAEAQEAYTALRQATEERETALRERIEELTAAQTRSSEQTKLDRARLEDLERCLGESQRQVATVVDDRALAEAEEANAALRQATEEREKALRERIDELTAEQARSSEQTEVDRSRVEELELRLAEAQLQVTPAAEETSDSGSHAGNRHTLLLSTPSGYQLVEAEGPAPLPGVVLSLPVGEYRVLRLGPSPLPGDSDRCAYLEELSPDQT